VDGFLTILQQIYSETVYRILSESAEFLSKILQKHFDLFFLDTL